MKKALFYSSALTACMAAMPVYTAQAAIVTTTTRTYTYEFPTSTPVTSENVSTVTDCPVTTGGGGGGGGGDGGGYGVDVNGDGVGDYGSQQDARDAGFNNGTTVGNYDNTYGQDPNSCGNCNTGSSGSGGSGGGCFLTTAVVTVTGEADDGPTLTKMRHLRDHYVTGTRDGMERIDVYYLLAPEIVRRVNIRPDARAVWKGLFNDWIAPIGKMVDQEQWLEADRTYSAMLHELVGRYLLSDYHRMPAEFKAALDESIAFRSV